MVGQRQTPTLARIKNGASESDVRALLYIAVCEVCDFFNVGKTMNDTQTAKTVDLILESFWHLRLAEIKFCFHRAMRREKLFDRLDGNIILGWLEQYDAERTEEALRISENESTQTASRETVSDGAISFDKYLDSLREKAPMDPEAAEALAVAEEVMSRKVPEKTDKARFRQQYYRDYLGKKQQIKNK